MTTETTTRGTKLREIHIVFFGIGFKSILFKKLCEAALKYERHITYEDTYYLKFNVDGEDVIIELVDPGLEHTGAREMSIRKAEGAILFYNSCSAPSYHQLAELFNDFENRQSDSKLPILLIASEDDYTDEGCFETSSTGQSSGSEDYEPETSTTPSERWRKRSSMERVRICNEERIPAEQGKQLAQLFGSQCKFVHRTISDFTGTKGLIEEMIRSIRGQHRQRTNFLARTRASSFPKAKRTVLPKNENSPQGPRSLSVKEKVLLSHISSTTPKRKRSVSKTRSTTACTIS